VRRYKLYGPTLLEVGLRPGEVEEVRARELGRNASGVLARVAAGRRVIVTRRGTPLAAMLEIEEAIALYGAVIVPRREAEQRLLGEELDRRVRSARIRKLSRGIDRRRPAPGSGGRYS
jgi:prevent-host-death family protein